MERLTAQQAAAWSGGTWNGTPCAAFSIVSTDSRTLGPGALYVALKGARFDGHDFVDDALQAGAAAVVVDGAFTGGPAGAALLRVTDTRQALWKLAAGYREAVAPVTIGVTGSAGKSTVKELVGTMLRQRHRTATTVGNWNNDVGLPLSLLAMVPETAFGVFEIGSNHPGEIAALCKVLQPDWGVITNIGSAHLEFFESEAGVAQEKGALLEALPRDGVAFLDVDADYYAPLRARTSAPVVGIGMDRPADLVGAWNVAQREVVITDRDASGPVHLPLPLPGRHQVRNLLLAAAVARRAGVTWDQIRDGLAGFTPMPMRWNCCDIDGVRVINDAYNANPVSMRAALRTFEETPVIGRRWLVLGDMRELGRHAATAHAALGTDVADGTWDGLVAVGELAAGIVAATKQAGARIQTMVCGSAAEAGDWLTAQLGRGDAVLLKGSRGMHLERVVEAIERKRKGPHHGRKA